MPKKQPPLPVPKSAEALARAIFRDADRKLAESWRAGRRPAAPSQAFRIIPFS